MFGEEYKKAIEAIVKSGDVETCKPKTELTDAELIRDLNDRLHAHQRLVDRLDRRNRELEMELATLNRSAGS